MRAEIKPEDTIKDTVCPFMSAPMIVPSPLGMPQQALTLVTCVRKCMLFDASARGGQGGCSLAKSSMIEKPLSAILAGA